MELCLISKPVDHRPGAVVRRMHSPVEARATLIQNVARVMCSSVVSEIIDQRRGALNTIN